MDALVNNKPEFVRLLVDNGADVADFLTYGRLQQLYRSVRPKSLLFDLLQRKLEEGRLTLGLGAQPAREPPAGPPAFSLHEVSRVLKDFLHDACRGLYQAVSGAGGRGRGPWRRRADGPVLQERGPARRPPGQKGLLDLTQRSENPWRDLFLWAVLQNRHEMATYFWAMVSTPGGSGLRGPRGDGRLLTPGLLGPGGSGGRSGRLQDPQRDGPPGDRGRGGPHAVPGQVRAAGAG